MSILWLGNFVVKPEKQEEFMSVWQRYLKYIKENPEKFKEMKSIKLFTQRFGGISGAYVVMEEYDSLTDYEKLYMRVMEDKEFMKTIYQELMLLIDPVTYSANIWNVVK